MTRKIIVSLLILTVFGLIRWPLESRATADFKERHLLPPDLDLSLREKLGHNSFAAALGGARSLVASLQNLMAFVAWETQDWGLVESRYRMVTELQPRVPSYWELAAWHMAYNASGWYRYDWDGPRGDHDPEALRQLRLELWERYIQKGQKIFADGIRNNPINWKLLENAAMLASDPQKLPDHKLAAGYYGQAAKLPDVPLRLRRFEAYELSYLPERRDEAFKIFTQLYAEGGQNRVPTLLSTLLDMQMERGIPEASRVPISEIGSTPAEIYERLIDYTIYRRSRKSDISPQLFQYIKDLETELNIPPERGLPILKENVSH